MQDVHRATILRGFLQQESIRSTEKWTLAEGVLVFPEAICPFCRSAMRSSKIWLARGGRLLGRWKVLGNRLVKESLSVVTPHPHVSGNSICMGNQKHGNEAAALFLGLNPRDCYWKSEETWREWLYQEFKHICGHFKNSKMIVDRNEL